MTALNSLQRKAWEISENPQTEKKTKVQALSIARDCVINKMDLFFKGQAFDVGTGIKTIQVHLGNES